ncbi:pentatricopeptide repeat-containing protein At3g22690 [Rosa chinensis]|nr:pentatricopeptide repeat-containing protein At3g22690 [Rosa chinensis]
MGLEEEMFIGNSLIRFCADCGDLDYDRKVFDEMLGRNNVSRTSLSCGYGRMNMSVEAVSLFSEVVIASLGFRGEMLQQGLRPDKITMLSAISACAQISDSLSGTCCHGYFLGNGLEGWDTLEVQLRCSINGKKICFCLDCSHWTALMLQEINSRLRDAGHVPDLDNVLLDVDEKEKEYLLSRHS